MLQDTIQDDEVVSTVHIHRMTQSLQKQGTTWQSNRPPLCWKPSDASKLCSHLVNETDRWTNWAEDITIQV